MDGSYLSAIKGFEGFAQRAQWDHAQFSNGYGTKALHAGEVIDKAEADRRFAAAIAGAEQVVERHAPGLDEGTKAALTSLTYNAGSAWTSSGLGAAVAAGDIERARDLFVQYSNAGGETQPGLLARRIAELQWMGGPAAAPGPVLPASAALPASAVSAVPAMSSSAAIARRSVERQDMPFNEPDQSLVAQPLPVVLSAVSELRGSFVLGRVVGLSEMALSLRPSQNQRDDRQASA